jgi:antitoxin component of RelBE/YafQ-DinJ toxin-antitoxin module
MIQVLAKRRVVDDSQGVDLFMLGVPERFHGGNPSIASFPARFNEHGRKVWEDMLKSQEYLLGVRGMNPDARWNLAIRLYLRNVAEQGFNPFNDSTERSDNNDVMSWLRNARHKVVRFINRTDIFKVLSANRLEGTWVTVHQEDGYLLLTSYIAVEWEGTHYDLDQYLRTLSFVPYSTKEGSVLYKFIDPTVRLYCKIRNSAYAVLYYEIKVGGNIYFPSDIKPTKGVYHQFIYKNIWEPLVIAERFVDLPRRWKF